MTPAIEPINNGAPARGIRRGAIIGMGAVGSALAFTLLNEGQPSELILVDKDERRAVGEMMDLSHCTPYSQPVRLSAGGIDLVEHCDLIIINAGVAQASGESRIDLVKRNAAVYAEFFPALPRRNPGAIFCIITNPVDVMTRLAVHLGGIGPGQIFGTGTTLDTARFRLLLSQHLSIDPRNIHAYVIGEHGDSEVLVWSRAVVGPYPLEDYARRVGRPITPEVRAAIEHGVKRAAYQIIERKGATNFAIAVATQRICESVASNQSTMMTVSRQLGDAYNLGDVCLSIPCLMTREGAGEPMEMDLSPGEHDALMHSAETLDQVYRALDV